MWESVVKQVDTKSAAKILMPFCDLEADPYAPIIPLWGAALDLYTKSWFSKEPGEEAPHSGGCVTGRKGKNI